MTTEFFIALFVNLHSLSQFQAVFSFILLLLLCMIYGIESSGPFADSKNLSIIKKGIKYSLTVLLICLPVCLMPTPEELFKIRLSMLKLELTNKENVSLAVEEINRIATKLECKYLGCKEK